MRQGDFFFGRGLCVRWLAGTANRVRGAEPCLIAGQGEQSFASRPRRAVRLTGIAGVDFVRSGVLVGAEVETVLILVAQWGRGRREEFNHQSRDDQGQRNMQNCHHGLRSSTRNATAYFVSFHRDMPVGCPVFWSLVRGQDNPRETGAKKHHIHEVVPAQGNS
jgi:hypothetical protein